MRRIMLKSKIHRATVTAASVDYEGSITIDRNLMEAADIFTCEQVHVLDVNNGARLVTYAMPGESGEICINGAAARKVDVGDKVIIISYGGLVPREWEGFQPRLILVDEENRIIKVDVETVSTGRAPAAAEGAPHHAGSKDKERDA
ncbi:MAG: aspartate 1-decarboxylase [Actinomycetota bacterium]